MTTPATKAAPKPSKAAKAATKAKATSAQTSANGKATTKEAAPRKQAAPKPVKHCLEGCGGQTKGGDFLIGHDAKLKSLLQKAHVAGDTKIDLGGKDASRYHGMSPMDVAKERGWTGFLDKAKATAEAKANRPKRTPKAKGGPIEQGVTVQFTYRGAKRTGTVTEVTGERAKVEFSVEEGKTETRAFGKESLTRTA
jgi:hypothetical protein